MLEVQCHEHLDAVKTFAASIGKLAEFQAQLDFLDSYGNHGLPADAPGRIENKCVLTRDFAPHSFEFMIYRPAKDGGWARWFNGGLLYYGPRDNGVSAPQFSVSLDTSNEARWEIKT